MNLNLNLNLNRLSDINVSRDSSIRFKLCTEGKFDEICNNVNQSQIILKKFNSNKCIILSGIDKKLKKTKFLSKFK